MKQLQELQLLAWHVASALPTRQAGLLVIAANSLAPARPHNNFVRLSCRLMHESTMKTSSYRYLDAETFVMPPEGGAQEYGTGRADRKAHGGW